VSEVDNEFPVFPLLGLERGVLEKEFSRRESAEARVIDEDPLPCCDVSTDTGLRVLF
jgi:hypothetical protein